MLIHDQQREIYYYLQYRIKRYTFRFCHQACTLGHRISWTLFMTCLPIIIIASCWESSTRHPPALHLYKIMLCYTTRGWIFVKHSYIFVTQSKHVVVVARKANETSFKECYVKDGCVQIDKLERKYFEC